MPADTATTQTTEEPTAHDRHIAVCHAMAWAPGLIRFAARYTQSIDDAEDAYQRAMEVALTSAPATDPDTFRTWLHTVIRREAAAIAHARRREEPIAFEDLEQSIAEQATQEPGPDAVAEWRERYRGLQDAWTGLTEPQKLCLMLRSSGVSRSEIQEMTGFSERKVRRAISEGRARLMEWQVRMAAGEECLRVAELIDRTVDGSATRRDRRVLSRHIGHCVACRSSYRAQRECVSLVATLVPTALISAPALTGGPPDPGVALSWWERITGSATVRSAQAMQVVMDLPGLAATKAGAGAIAVAAAGVAGTPMVIDAVRSHRTDPPVIAATRLTPSRPPGARSARTTTPVDSLRARTRVVPRSRPTITLSTPRPSQIRAASPTRSATVHRSLGRPRRAPRAAPAASAALEFTP